MHADRSAANAALFQLRPCSPPASLAVILGLVAGWVDACVFLGLFGLFVAQVTGSFVFSGTRLVAGGPVELVQFLAIPVFFAGGVAATLTATAAQALRGPPLAVALTLELILLVAFVALSLRGAPYAGLDAAMAPALCAIAAMGVQSASVRLLMSNTPSTNVMTTNTSQLAIDATQAMFGLLRPAAQPSEAAQVAAIRRRLAAGIRVTLAFFAGAVGGGLAFLQTGLIALVLPLAALAGVTAWAFWRERAWSA